MIISASYNWQARTEKVLPLSHQRCQFIFRPKNDKFYQDANFFSLFDTFVLNNLKGVLAKKFKSYISQITQKMIFKYIPKNKKSECSTGNHSAGKSSFINWYIEEHVQRTGVAIETQGFSFITSGRRWETPPHPFWKL